MQFARGTAAAIAIVMAAQACSRPEKATAPATVGEVAVPVRFVPVARATVRREVVLPAEIDAWQEVTLHAKVPGYIRLIAVDRGDSVKSGEVVAELDAPELAADVAKARADAELASTLAARVGRAHGKAPDLVVTQSVDEASAKLAVARAALSRAETLLSFATIRAPFAGVVTERFVDPGSFVPAATATATPRTAAVVTVADLGRLRVRVPIPEREATLVRAGTVAEVVVDQSATEPVPASVSRISWSLDRETRTMIAEVDLSNEPARLRPGMLAHVRLVVDEHRNALALPVQAVSVEKGGTFVFLVDESGHARKKAIRGGFTDRTNVEIVEGAPEGARAVILESQGLRDGQAVREKDPR